MTLDQEVNMTVMDRDVYLRNHVMGVLVTYSDKGFSYAGMGELADAITESVIEGDRKWHEANCCDQILDIAVCDQDLPQ